MENQEHALHEIAYVSQRARHVSDDDIVEQIVIPSIQRNRAQSLNGSLWFDPTRFIHFLEGARSDVERMFTRIRRDDRHSEIHILSDAQVATRSFEHWHLRPMKACAADGIEAIMSDYGVQCKKTRSRRRADLGPESMICRLRAVMCSEVPRLTFTLG